LIVGHLAAGRVGHLYQVWSTNGWCALTCKILSPQLRGDRGAAATLRREARILRALHHPNLIRGFGAGEHDSLPYLLMEYVEGPSLFELLERRPERRLGVSDALRTAIHIGAGLQHLHGAGYLHLDLKPANLLLRNKVPLLVDFDSARPVRSTRRPKHRLGTAPYMAPEQVHGHPLSPATDVYGLAAVLYELLTGRWPFEAVYTGDEAREGEERLYPQLGEAPPPPPEMHTPEIPRSLGATLLRALARPPEERFPSLHPFLLALSAELAEPASLWPGGLEIERRHHPRPTAEEALPAE
jgi:serine/threonine-protein kinase